MLCQNTSSHDSFEEFHIQIFADDFCEAFVIFLTFSAQVACRGKRLKIFLQANGIQKFSAKVVVVEDAVDVSAQDISRRNNFLSAQIAVARVNFVTVKIFAYDSAAEEFKIDFGERDLPREFFFGESRLNRQESEPVEFGVNRFKPPHIPTIAAPS